MKKSILYAVVAVAIVAVAAIAIGGCDGDLGERSDNMDAYLDKFHYNKKAVKKVSLKYNGNGVACGAPVTDEPQYDSGTAIYLKYPCSMTNGDLIFIRWSSRDGKYSGDPDGRFVLIEDITLYAVWDTVKAYDVTVTSSITGMYISGSGRRRVGETVRLDAGTPPDGWTFQNWTQTNATGERVSFDDANSAKTTFIMPKNSVTVMAVFAIKSGTEGWFTDNRDNKTYRIVTIAEQTWMAQNLNYLNDMSEGDSSWCYDNDPDNCATYGRLYTWNAAMKACPAGWKLPDTADWNRLVMAVGGKDVAGKKLKSKTGWSDKSVWETNYGTDDYEFGALPGGRYYRGSFDGAGKDGEWWTASVDNGSDYPYKQQMYYNYDFTFNGNYEIKGVAYSVRCVKKD